jgi:hypothetical protein
MLAVQFERDAKLSGLRLLFVHRIILSPFIKRAHQGRESPGDGARLGIKDHHMRVGLDVDDAGSSLIDILGLRFSEEDRHLSRQVPESVK